MHRIDFTHCFIGIAATAALLVAFGVQLSSLLFLAAVLACPLVMVVMMRGMMSSHGGADVGRDHPEHQPDQHDQPGGERTR